MNETDKAYIAGVLDCDGSIGIQRNQGQYYRLTVQMCNSSLDLMEYLRDTIPDSGKMFADPPIISANRKRTCYYLTLSGQKAASLISEVLPYIVGEKDQATLALQFTRYREAVGYNSSGWYQQDMEDMYQEMKSLHARGTELVGGVTS